MRKEADMLTKTDRQKNKAKIFLNYRVEYLRDGEEDSRQGYVNAESWDHAKKLYEQILDHQGFKAKILSIEEEDTY
jgi:hypothetical protein